MASGNVVWDGARRLGPVDLGMTLQEIKGLLPGEGSWGDDIGDSEIPFHWDSEALGLSVQTLLGVTISITACRTCLLAGEELIGMPAHRAVGLAGGETARDFGDPIMSIFTASGVELSIEDDRVLWVTLWETDDVINSL